MLAKLENWWKELCRSMNEKGIPIPMIRDPKTKVGSVSLTLVFITFNVWLASMIGKVAGVLGGLSTADALNMFMVAAGLYWGRKFQKDGDKVELDKN